MKQLFVTLILLCLLAASASAQTADGFVCSIRDGSAVITGYTGSAAVLSIPDTLDGYPVTAIGYCAFRDCAFLTQVTLPEGVTAIGSNAFERCTSLKKVILPDSLASIGTHAFYACASLEQIDIPEGIVRLHPYAFYGCSAVRFCSRGGQAALVLSDYGYTFADPSCPQLLLKAFADESGARSLTVADCDESVVSLVLPDGVTTIARNAFRSCASLRQLTLPASVSLIEEGAFSGCRDVAVIAPAASAGHELAQAMAASGFTWQSP